MAVEENVMVNKQIFSALFVILAGLNVATATIQAQEENRKISSFTDPREGRTYRTVELGDEVWMAENLHYSFNEKAPYYDWDKKNEQIYGRLYAWGQAQQACPTGWHLPSTEEWVDLLNIFGEIYDYDGKLLVKKNKKKLSKEERKMGEKLHTDAWQHFQVGGITGFDVLYGGELVIQSGAYDWRLGGRPTNVSFAGLEKLARFWSASNNMKNFVMRDNGADNIVFVSASTGKEQFLLHPIRKSTFLSVRCVMDKPDSLNTEK